MQNKVCCCLGGVCSFDYSRLESMTFSKLEELIKDGYNIFYCEMYGDFAKICKEAIEDLEIRYPFIRLKVLFHITEDIVKYSDFVFWCTDGGMKNSNFELLETAILKYKEIFFIDSFCGINKI